MKLRLVDVAAAVRGTLVGEDALADGVSIDSRVITPANLFVPLVGERDGHDFVELARAKGAIAHLTTRPTGADREIVVADTAEALKDLALAARTRMMCTVVGVTGSSGKTSTKDLLASVLAQRGAIAASEKSFNNELGVPLTLLNASDDIWAAVVEMGARGKGHIAALCRIARPTLGIVTNVGVAHLGEFGSVEAIADAKAELLDSLPQGGVAVLNADDPSFGVMVERARQRSARIVRFGCREETIGSKQPDDAVHATEIVLDSGLRPSFVVRSGWGSVPITLRARGAHQVPNALAAAAAALSMGVTLEELQVGLRAAVLSPARMDLVACRSGARVLNDSYNANPASMRVGLDALLGLTDARRHVAVLGVMAELGERSAELHQEIARWATAQGIEVVAVDTDAYGPGVVVASDHDAALAMVGALGAGDAVLVKGSLVAGLQALAARLIEAAGGPTDRDR